MAFNDTFIFITAVSVMAIGFAFFLRDPVLDAHNREQRAAAPPEPEAGRPAPATSTPQAAGAA